MKILVTGGAGFIASHIVDAFVNEGHEVTVLDNLSSGKKDNVNPKAKFYEGDIRDSALVEKIFSGEQIEVLDHHAAQIDVRKSVADPVFDAEVNITGTLNLFQNCVKHNVKKIIFASSGGVMYGECKEQPPTEEMPAVPLSPYGVSKRTAELYLYYYAATYGIKYLVLRYGNVYGPRQDPHGEAGVVAIFTQRMLANEEVYIFGNGEQLRDYVFVHDVVKANLLGTKKGENEIINIGTKCATSVNTLFNELAHIVQYSKKPIYKPHRTGELNKSFLDNAKAVNLLGWNARYDFGTGLQKTVEFFQEAARTGRVS